MITYKKRFFFLLAIMLATAAYFWIESRYPDLNSKAIMAQSGTVHDTIAARPMYEVKPEYSLPKKVALTTINWCNDNKKGMTFGVFFAALLLTMVSYIAMPTRQNRIYNTLYGFFIGAPLGVCVNCSAPIFKGILASERVETAFATMLSSPTMNVVVMTMVFSLFPPYMAITKVLFALLAIFVGVPLIAKALGPEHVLKDIAKASAAKRFLTPDAPNISIEGGAGEGFMHAIYAALVALAKNLWFMISRTVPLMLVAGFFGSLLSHVVPVSVISGSGSAWAVAVAAVVGILLPVPMAFDVMLANALYSHGAPVAVVMTLLCTLGIYSMYSFFITWQSASRAWAVSMISLLAFMGFVAGMLAPPLHDFFYIEKNLAAYHLLAVAPSEESAINQKGRAAVPPFVAAAKVAYSEQAVQGGSLAQAPFRARESAANQPEFSFLEGHEIGITRGFRYGIRDYPDPFWIGRGTAVGDIDRDGWPDLVLGSEAGFYLYRNRGGHFVEVSKPGSSFDRYQVYAVALYDFDNDSWPDLYFTTYQHGNYLVKNQQGELDPRTAIKIGSGQALLTVSPAFADFDGDGRLDIMAGNMALGIVSGFHDFSARRASALVFNRQQGFAEVALGGDAGETMATLASDLNGDGAPDLVLGHDFVFPDTVYINDGKGQMQQNDDLKFLAKTPVFTMGIDSGDVNNDLQSDLLMVGTIERRRWVGKEPIDGLAPAQYAKGQWDVPTCQTIKDPIVRENCVLLRSSDHLAPFYQHRNLEVQDCQKLSTVLARQDCLVSAMWLLITNEERSWNCEQEFAGDVRLLSVCRALKERGARRDAGQFTASRPQNDGNYLFLGQKQGGFRDIDADQAEPTLFRHPGGWTWGTRIADLDNDGWQDIFTAEGAVRSHDYGFNAYLKNQQGQGFVQKQFSAGLTNPFNLFSFVVVDFDLDGDLDIIGNSAVGPVQVYRNNTPPSRHAFALSLRGKAGDEGIGAKVTITYEGQKQQMREVKASGSYQSFDLPEAFFGVDGATAVDKVEVLWRDGQRTILNGPLATDHRYILKLD